MKFNFKRLMAILLSVMMVVSLLPTSVFAMSLDDLQDAIDNGDGEITLDGDIIDDVSHPVVVDFAAGGSQSFASLAEAFNAATAGDEIEIRVAGTYSLSGIAGKNITVTGTVDGVVFDNIGAFNMGGANVTFDKVAFDYYPNVNYTGLQHSGDLVYNNCTFNGQVFLYGQSETFNTCTFNQDSADAYNVWTYGAKEVEFNGCTFYSAGKSVLVYNEGGPATELEVIDTDFIASGSVSGKAAIEIDTSAPNNPGAMDGTVITIDADTTATGFATDTKSGSSLWNDKKVVNDQPNGGTTSVVVVAGETVKDSVDNAPAETYVAEVNGTKYTDIQDAIVAATPNGTVELLSNVTVDTWKMFASDMTNDKIITCDVEGVTIDGKGYTLTIDEVVSGGNGARMFYDAENLTIKDLTINLGDGASGIGLKSGTISDVTFNGGVYGVIPQDGEITITGCTFATNGTAIYYEEARDNLTVTSCTFNQPADVNVILLRGATKFSNNTVNSGRTVNIVSGSPTVTGNDFNDVRLKVYNEATATIVSNEINNLVFNDATTTQSTFTSNTLSTEAQAALDAVSATSTPTVVEVTTYEQLVALFTRDTARESVKAILMNDITGTAAESSGYGKAGIVLKAGDVLDGNGKTLTINGANSTWDCAIAMRGGEVKNLTIAGAMRGVFMPGANGDVVIDTCVFKDVVYTFNSDAGSKDYTVTVKNTTLNGWTSFSDVHKSVTFDTCAFGEGSGYKFCRPYQSTTFTNCTFDEGYEFDTSKTADDSLAFNNCTYAGVALSADNNAMFYKGGSVMINGVSTDVTPPTGSNSPAYTKEVDGYVRIWGEGGGNAKESFVLKLYSDETLIATTTLNNVGGIINGNVYVTWNFYYPSSNDEYWTTTWEEGHPNASAQPTKVELIIDGTVVATTDAQMNGADNLNPVVWAELVRSRIAQVGDDYYTNLQTAIDSVPDDGTIVLLSDVTLSGQLINQWYEGLYYEGDKSFTIDLGGFKITNDSTVTDYLMLFKNSGSKANEITFKNGTIEATSSAYCAICTSSGSTQQITVNLENINVIGNNSNGSVIKVRGGTVLNVKSVTKITGTDSYLGIEAYAATANIYAGAEIYMNGTTSYNGCLVGVAANGTVNVYGGYGKGVKGGFIAMTSGGTINVSGGEWIANTDGTCASDNKAVLVAQNDKNTYPTANASIINVTGGTFKGGYNCYAYQTAADAQIVINGGNFNSDPTAYVASGYKAEEADGVYTVVKDAVPVAQIGNDKYTSLADAAAVAVSGDEIVLIADAYIAENTDVTIPDGVTLNGNGFSIYASGADHDTTTSYGYVVAGGNLTIKNVTRIEKFSASYYNHVITIGEGSSLQVFGKNRVSLGYGSSIDVIGSLDNAKTADKTQITPSLNIAAGFSIVGSNDTYLKVENAYVVIGSTSSKNNNAGGNFNLSFTNCIVEFTNQFTTAAPKYDTLNPTFNVTFKDSLVTTATKMILMAPGSNLVVDNSTVTLATYFRNSGVVTLTNGSVLTGSTIQFGENGGNDGDIIVDASELNITATSTGHALDGNSTGTLTVKNGGTASVTYMTNHATIYLAAGTTLTSESENLTITTDAGYEVKYNADTSVYSVEKGSVASVTSGDTVSYYDTLTEALKALTDNATLTLISDVTVSDAWDCRYNGAKITASNVTIDGNGKTIKLTGNVNDKNWNTVFRFEGDNAVVKNLTIDASEATGIQRGISAKYNITVEGCTLIGNGASAKRAIIFGEGAGAAVSNVTVTITDSTFKGWSYGVSDNQSGKDAKSVTITGSTFENASVLVSASESVTFTGNNVTNGYVNISSYSVPNELNVTATGNTLDITNYAEDNTITAATINAQDEFITPVAVAGGVYYTTMAKAFSRSTEGATITLLADVALSETVTVEKTVTLDLNGKTISGTCGASQAHLFMVNNAVTLTIKDSSTEQTGKITYAGNNSTGWIIDVEGALVLESGTLELTGTWNIGYAVDVRPNAWGTAYTAPTSFTMNGGKIVSSDGAVRVASTSADTHSGVSASFTMEGGEIDAAWDGVFVQQSNAAWDVLNVTINNGTIKAALNPIRFYGPAATSYVNGEDCVDITLNGGTLTYTGTETREWLVDGILRIGGGVTADDVLKDSDIIASGTFASANVAEGYEWVAGTDGKYALTKVEEVETPITFANAGHNLRLQDLIKIGFYFTATPAAEKTATEVGAYIWAAGTDEASALKVVATYNSETGKYTVESNGIKAQELDVMYYAKYYAVIDGVEYSDVVDDYAATEYLEYVYNYYTSGNLLSTRSLVIDLANYAAMAQTYFALSNDAEVPEQLINSFMDDADKTLNWSDDLKRSNPTVSKSTSGGYNATWGGANVNLVDALSLSFIVNNTDVEGVIYWTQADYEANSTLSYENKSGEGTTRQGLSGGKNSTFGTIPGLYSFNIYDNYYAAMYKKDGDNYLYSDVYGRSIASYASYWVDYYASATAEKDVALRELCKAMLIYGNNAETYFD